MIDTKEIRKALAIHGVDVLNVDEVLDVLDHLEAAYKEIESWKGVTKQFSNDADTLRTHLSFAKDELNRLRTKIAEMENQELVAWMDRHGTLYNSVSHVRPSDKPLYALPGAQPAANFADAYQGAMEEVAIWKKRALEAEDLNRKFVAEINGPTYMGEPAQPAPSVPDGWKLVPIDPTRNMLDIMDLGSNMLYRYRALLAAAPEAKP
jgi:hypothetical protein